MKGRDGRGYGRLEIHQKQGRERQSINDTFGKNEGRMRSDVRKKGREEIEGEGQKRKRKKERS